MLANLRFASGGVGSISGVCPCDYGYDARVEIVGKKGIMQIGEMQGQAWSSAWTGITGSSHHLPPVAERFAWGYINEMQHFVECIRGDTLPRVTGHDGRWALAGVLAGTKSLYMNDQFASPKSWRLKMLAAVYMDRMILRVEQVPGRSPAREKYCSKCSPPASAARICASCKADTANTVWDRSHSGA